MDFKEIRPGTQQSLPSNRLCLASGLISRINASTGFLSWRLRSGNQRESGWLAPELQKVVRQTQQQFVAFTLLELLMVVAVIGILAAMLLPTVNRVKAHGSRAGCLNNLKQLQMCWQMYVDDKTGFVPPNQSLITNGAWRSTPDSWIGNSSAPYDTDFLPIQQGLLFKYDYNRSLALYHCPSDRSRVVDAHSGKITQVQRTRSYSMSGCLGGRTNEAQVSVNRADQIPEPAHLFVFIDEDEDSIDDAHFLTWPAPDERWVNLPAGRHGQSGVLSFADGHAEVWKWLWPKQFKKKQSYWKSAESAGDLSDLRRLQDNVLPVPNYVPRPY